MSDFNSPETAETEMPATNATTGRSRWSRRFLIGGAVGLAGLIGLGALAANAGGGWNCPRGGMGPGMMGPGMMGQGMMGQGMGGWGHGKHHGMHMGFFGGKGQMDPAMRAQMMGQRVDFMLSSVNATDEQKAKVKEILTTAMQDMPALRDTFMGTRTEMMKLLSAETVDRNAIETLRADRIAKADEASKRMAAALANIAEVLTPEQRQQLAQNMANRMGKRWGGMGGMGGPMMMGPGMQGMGGMGGPMMMNPGMQGMGGMGGPMMMNPGMQGMGGMGGPMMMNPGMQGMGGSNAQ